MAVKPRRRRQKPPSLRVLDGGKSQHARRLIQKYLPLLRTYRDVESFYAFVWPEEARTAHSVIDRSYGLEPQERDAQAAWRQDLEKRYHELEALMRATEETA